MGVESFEGGKGMGILGFVFVPVSMGRRGGHSSGPCLITNGIISELEISGESLYRAHCRNSKQRSFRPRSRIFNL